MEFIIIMSLLSLGL